MRIALLPDTRPEAGLGHLRRCQALASALERLGCECVWPEQLPRQAHDFPADVLVIDEYDRTAHECALFHRHYSTVVRFVDDATGGRLADQLGHVGADIVINGAPGAESLPYKLRDGATALLGPQYLCLDPAIASAPKRELQPEVKNILVSLGYAPDQQMLDRIAVAVSTAAPDAVVQTLYGAPPGMLVLLLNTWADLAITGGGQTMLESVALGVPTIAVCMGENQFAQVAGLHLRKIVEGVSIESFLAGHHNGTLGLLVSSPLERAKMSAAGRTLIDGRGAERVARAIVDRIERGA